MQPLPDMELEERVAKAVQNVATLDNLVIKKNLGVSFAYLRHAMMKVTYELAFLWLGESYLDDPSADVLRRAICSPDAASTDMIAGYVGDLKGCTPFQFWTPHPAHHLA